MPIRSHDATRRRVANRKYDDARGSARERGYSTKWDKFARSYLARNPLCLYCFTQGRVTASEVVDHIVPHRGDKGLFWPPYGERVDHWFAACCRDCHNGPKQRAEALADKLGRDVRSILCDWGMLPPGFPGTDRASIIPNTVAALFCGPPAAGKTHAARRWAKNANAVIYDLDDLAGQLGFPRFGRTHDQAKKLVSRREVELSRHPADRAAALIASAPTPQERVHWQDRLGTTATLLIEPRDVLLQRVRDRSATDAEVAAQIEAIDYWFARAGAE